MKSSFIKLIRCVLMGWLIIPASVMACDYLVDGCLGCTDDELPICVQSLVEQVCLASSYPDNCDTARVYDDAESYILSNTSHHLNRIRKMVRSPNKYQRH